MKRRQGFRCKKKVDPEYRGMAARTGKIGETVPNGLPKGAPHALLVHNDQSQQVEGSYQSKPRSQTHEQNA